MATPPNIIYHWKTYHTHSCTTLSLAHLLTCFRYWNFGVAISSWHRTGCVKGGCFYFVIFNFLKPWYIMVHLVIKCYKGQFCCSFPTTEQNSAGLAPSRWWKCFVLGHQIIPDPFRHILAGGVCTPEKETKTIRTAWNDMDQHSNRLEHMEALHNAPDPLVENPYPTTPKKTAAGPKTAQWCCTIFIHFPHLILTCFERLP